MIFLPPITALLLFPAMLLLLEVGRRLRNRRSNAEGNTVAENAVFGLFSLLLAFTFSGATARYDAHRALLTEETNTIHTAYLRLDLLPLRPSPHSGISSATTPHRASNSSTPPEPRSLPKLSAYRPRSGSAPSQLPLRPPPPPTPGCSFRPSIP